MEKGARRVLIVLVAGLAAAIALVWLAVIGARRGPIAAGPVDAPGEVAAGVPTSWFYSTDPDPLGRGATRLACVVSAEPVSLQPPYGDPYVRLCVRRRGGRAPDAYLQIVGDGQFACISDCSVTVRFGDGKSRRFAGNEAGDGNTGVLFIEGAKGLIAGGRKASKVTLEATFYQGGDQAMVFATPRPLVWN
ncbi:MAG TPA: hypothetical protein VGH15_05720 [Caulobacteraceae bacterium]|jgi:hypothetical protein